MSLAGGPLQHQGDTLTVQPYGDARPRPRTDGTAYLVEVQGEAASQALAATLPLLDRLLTEKLAEERERRVGEVIDFLAAQMLTPSATEMAMARQVAARHARVLNEFGCYTAEELADANGSQASQRSALADNWRKRRQVFAVAHPDRKARDRDVYPAFQFDEGGRPLKVVQAVLDAFDGRKTPWKLALWFTSNNGALPDSARPVDLLRSQPEAVVAAARRDALEAGV